MKTLSIRQPWAWLIIHGGKDIENRDWSTKVRGRIFVHASKGMTRAEYLYACNYIDVWDLPVVLPGYSTLQRGGVIGTVEIVDCVEHHDSPWFVGRYGFVLREPKPLPFYRCNGMLGFFSIPYWEVLGVPTSTKEGAL